MEIEIVVTKKVEIESTVPSEMLSLLSEYGADWWQDYYYLDKRLGAYGGEHLLKGGQLIFVVYNDRTAHSLTLEKMLRGCI